MVTKAVDEIASYANITIDDTTNDNENIITLDNFKSKKVEDIKSYLEEHNIKPIILGSGDYIINQYPLENSKVVKNSKVFIVTNNNDYKLPNFKNWSLSEVKTYCKLAGINLTYTGYGYVISQSVEENSEVTSDMSLNITLGEKMKD